MRNGSTALLAVLTLTLTLTLALALARSHSHQYDGRMKANKQVRVDGLSAQAMATNNRSFDDIGEYNKLFLLVIRDFVHGKRDEIRKALDEAKGKVECAHLVENEIQFDHSLQHLTHARMQCLRLLVCELVDLFRRNTMEMGCGGLTEALASGLLYDTLCADVRDLHLPLCLLCTLAAKANSTERAQAK